MAWFKVDDSLWAHPKWITLSAQAKALWVTAASWSAQYETFGKVSTEFLKSFAGVANPKKSAQELVNSGLWEVADDGYQFHEWDAYNLSETAWESRKAATRERVKRHRNGKKNTKCNDVTDTASNRGCNGVTDGVTSEPEPDIDTPDGVSHPLTPSQGAQSDSTTPTPAHATLDATADQTSPATPTPATPSTPTSSTPDCHPGFEAFWDAYRHHGNKTQARKAYKTARKAGYSAQWLTQQAASYHQRADTAHTPPQYRKHAATWLNNAGWDDQFTPQHSHQPASLLTRSQQAAAAALQAALAEQHTTPSSPPPRALTTGCEVPF